MGAPCEAVHAFVDGELAPAAHARFLEHLDGCGRCQGEAESILVLRALAETAAGSSAAADRGGEGDGGANAGSAWGPDGDPWRSAVPAGGRPAGDGPARSRWRLVRVSVIVGALAAAAALAFAWWGEARRGPAGVSDPPLFAMDGPTRPFEARLAHPAAAAHRPVEVMRGGGGRGGLDFGALARLQQQGDLKGLVTRLLADRALAQARQVLDGHPDRGDLDDERAVLALLEGRAELALAHAATVLGRAPRAPAALWNRALALRALGLPFAAAEAFEAVAAQQEPGWAQEALTQAAHARAAGEEAKRRWESAEREGLRLVLDGTPPGAETLERLPDLVRLYFYEAVRAAPSRARVESLLPLARRLDQVYGGDALERYARRVAGADFARRGPLAARYGALVAARWVDPQPGATAALVEELRRARLGDLLFGALVGGRLGAHEPEELRRLAGEGGDPWLELVAVEVLTPAAEAALRSGVDRAAGAKLSYRGLRLQLQLGYLLVAQLRLTEAAALLAEVRGRAAAAGYWPVALSTLLPLANLANHRDEAALLDAYAREAVLADGSCRVRHYVRQLEAERALFQGRLEDARAAVAAVPDCGAGAAGGLAVLYVRSELARRSRDRAELASVRDEAARLSTQVGPAQRALVLAFEGRALVELAPAEGQRRLREALAATEALPAADAHVAKARTLALRALADEAARAGAPDEALTTIAAERRATLPSSCVLGLSLDGDRRVAVARGPDGRSVVERRTALPVGGLEAPVSDDLQTVLRGCPEVAVIAAAPLHGRPRILGSDVAWRHHRTGGVVRASSLVRRLVVADVSPPASLALPALSPWQTPPGEAAPDRLLRGAEATPAAVAAALAEADRIEFHVHGLVDLNVSDASFLVLSPGPEGRFALTAADVRRLTLPRAPLVVLAACHSAATTPFAPYLNAEWSLPDAFLDAGARAVFGAAVPLPDRGARVFFDELARRIDEGLSPARALRDTRLAFHEREPAATWVDEVVLFE